MTSAPVRSPEIAHVYVDGFNLYFGALRKTTYKWLDLSELCRLSLPAHYQVQRLRYFTASVTARPDDPQKPVRQQTYIRALETLPNLTMHYGQFLTSHVRMPLVSPSPGEPKTVEVIKTEEKGSDVNIATYMILDACTTAFDVAVVVSDDSDLAEPIRVVRREFNRRVVVLSPRGRSRELSVAATRFHRIEPRNLAASQFPQHLSDAHGSFTKPSTW